MAAGEMKMFEVGGFDVKTTMIKMHIDVQKCDLGEGGMCQVNLTG